MLELRTHRTISELDEAAWDRLLGSPVVPHLRHAFLRALEDTGCVVPERGWLPQHLSLYQDGKLVTVAPAFVKGNSDGEFVFDHSWARYAYESLGIDYFPKLIVAVPFTPATGPRFLHAAELDPKHVAAALVEGLRHIVESSELSSAHILFPSAMQAKALAGAGMCMRHGVQYHWHNAGYRSFDDFLARFSSKKRNQIRRERRQLRERGIVVKALRGGELGSADIDHAYEFYCSTVDRHFYGRRYLNRDFFHEICAKMPENVLVVFAFRQGAQRPIAGAFNLLGEQALYGRYWGASEEEPFLHFEVCYYAGVDYCIEHGLTRFEPGAGGEHKHARGFQSTITYSLHHIGEPALRAPIEDFVARERRAIRESLLAEKSLLKPPAQVD